MNCPDCGSRLIDVNSASGVVMRCYKCGGFWLDGTTANNMTSVELNSSRRISVSTSFLTGGRGVCPGDGLKLVRYQGEQIPVNVSMMRCERCGKWWFPGDNLFLYKPAVEAKTMYLRLWGVPFQPKSVLLPLVLVTLLLGGAVTGVTLVQQRQGVPTAAKGLLTEFSGNYLGRGEAIIGFKSRIAVSEVEYRRADDKDWEWADVVFMNGFYVVNLAGLVEGEGYVVRIAGEEWGFVAK